VATFEDDFGVIQISPDLDYQDGSEDIILQTLINANDRSVGSDELAEAIVDWPTRYHFSRLRQELFMPFKVEKGTRVLEIGCGTGVNLRYFAELGAEVVGVEGTLKRARAARVRCEGMQNVTVYAGDANVLPDLESFDLVLLIGVLEYSGARGGGFGTPEKLLATASKFLKADGSLILAIENQIGLKYLLGYPEDHLGVPWVGPEGYKEASGIRTWTRAGLSNLLIENGFSSQNWFYPYPDYKLPHFVASQDLYSTDLGQSAVKSILRSPVVDYSGSPELACDPVWASQTMIDAGIGPDVSNSFLVLASRQENAQAKFVSSGLGWLANGERLSQWRNRRVLVETEGKFQFRLEPGKETHEDESSGWLKQKRLNNVDYVEGLVLEDEILRNLILNDLENVKNNLVRYFQYLKDHIVVTQDSAKVQNPFVIDNSIGYLDGMMLDCVPKNLIIDENNHINFIDKEWQPFGNVSLEAVWQRGMTDLALRILQTNTPTPFGPLATVSDLIYSFSTIAEAPCSTLITEQFLQAEAELQRIISGYDSTTGLSERHKMNSGHFWKGNSRLSKYRHLVHMTTHIEGLNHLRKDELAQQSALQQQVETKSAELENVSGELLHVRAELENVSGELLHVRAELENVSGELLHVRAELENVSGELLHVRAERDSYLESWSVEIGFMVTWPFRRLKSVVRQLLK
jgi:SAM-dependent methyltransferase